MNRLRALLQGVMVAGALLGAAAAAGVAVRVFLWSSGLGG